jgi:6-phosphogluconolactonase
LRKTQLMQMNLLAAALGCGISSPVPALQDASNSQPVPPQVASPSQASSGPAREPERLWVYVGTYTTGIYQYELNLTSGTLRAAGVTTGVQNPSFLALHPSGRYLYAVDEVSSFGGLETGAVSAFSLDPGTGRLSLLNHQTSGGSGPCHLSVDRSGRYVLIANYTSGSIQALPIQEDGSLGAPSLNSFVQHRGASRANTRRQGGPHAHSINLDPENRFAYVADLGLDKLLVYRFDASGGALEASEPAFVSTAPGAGPRHFAFHPGGRYAFLLNELSSTITAFSFDAGTGALTEAQTLSTLPEGYRGSNLTAEVQVHPSGKFLYSSNRGHNSIAIFAIDEETGALRAIGHPKSGGRTPRNFGIDPTGRYLLAANQLSNTVVVFRIDPETGALSPTGASVEVPSPVCVKFLPAPAPERPVDFSRRASGG